MEKHIDAGALRERLRVLKLAYDEDGREWAWQTDYSTSGAAELSERKAIFSDNAVGARSVSFTVRHRAALTLDRAIAWRGPGGWEHCFIVSILPIDRLYDTVRCARVRTVRCVADAGGDPAGPAFPGVLSEKYVGHEEWDPLDVTVTTYVLVTPKCIRLEHGSLVEAGGTPYHVLLGHYLDPWKNEFEIRRTEDN